MIDRTEEDIAQDQREAKFEQRVRDDEITQDRRIANLEQRMRERAEIAQGLERRIAVLEILTRPLNDLEQRVSEAIKVIGEMRDLLHHIRGKLPGG
jgi:hypothetical protein